MGENVGAIVVSVMMSVIFMLVWHKRWQKEDYLKEIRSLTARNEAINDVKKQLLKVIDRLKIENDIIKEVRAIFETEGVKQATGCDVVSRNRFNGPGSREEQDRSRQACEGRGTSCTCFIDGEVRKCGSVQCDEGCGPFIRR